MQRQNWCHQQWKNIVMMAQMKVDIAFPTQMTEHGSYEGVVNYSLLIHRLSIYDYLRNSLNF